MIVGDSDIFNENVVPGGWTWADLGNYYGSRLSASISTTTFIDWFAPSAKVEIRLTLRIEPEMHAMEFINEVVTGGAGSGDNAYIYGAPIRIFVMYRAAYLPASKHLRLKERNGPAATVC